MRTPACSSGLGGSGREGSPVSLGSSQSSALHHSAILKVVLSARSCCARSGPDGDGAKSYQHKERNANRRVTARWLLGRRCSVCVLFARF